MPPRHDNPLKPVELAFKRVALGAARPFFQRPEQFDPPDLSAVKRILFLRYDKLGDMVVTLPVFETVRRLHPHIRIGVVASPRNEEIIRHDPRIDQVFVYDKRPASIPGLVRSVRRGRYDVVVAMISLRSVTSLFMAQLLGPNSYRIGLGQQEYSEYYHHIVTVPPSLRQHMVEQSLSTLSALGITREQCIVRAPLHLPDDSRAKAAAFLNGAERPLGVNISAGKPNRIWQREKYTRVVSELARCHPDFDIVILCAPDDRELADQIRRDSGVSARVVPAGLSIIDAAAIVARLRALITPDTSMPHIARSFAVPVVGLYSRDERNTASWRPYGQDVGLIVAQSIGDIFDITPEQVLDETARTLAAYEEVHS